MNEQNPNYRPNALSRFYETVIAGGGTVWTALGWAPRNYVKVLAVVFLASSPFWLWLIYRVWGEILTLTGDTVPKTTSDDLRNIAYALGITITALAGLLAAPLILIRTWVNERHATTAEQGLITDRITRAVEQLGAEKTVKRREFKPKFNVDKDGKRIIGKDQNSEIATNSDGSKIGDHESIEETLPNLEVRLGAIYALERIAQDSERDHIPIMETLCAYIRENAPPSGADDKGDDWPDWPDDADDDDEVHAKLLADLKTRVRNLPAPRVDIQTALSVIGRRGEDRIAHERRQRRDVHDNASGFRLDLRNTNLQKSDLTHAQLDNALLHEARMPGANLWRARMQGEDLHSAILKSADLKDWTCARTSFRSADFTDSKHLTQDHVNAAFGDSATILPPGIVIPDHWDNETIEPLDDDPNYQDWLATGAPVAGQSQVDISSLPNHSQSTTKTPPNHYRWNPSLAAGNPAPNSA